MTKQMTGLPRSALTGCIAADVWESVARAYTGPEQLVFDVSSGTPGLEAHLCKE